MRPLRGLFGGETRAIAYRAGATTSASTTCAKPAGVAVGDLVIVVVPDLDTLTLTTSGGSAWTRDQINWSTLFYESVAFAKVLTALDVSNAWTFSATATGRATAWAGEDLGGVAIRSPGENVTLSAASLTLTGYTPTDTPLAVAIVIDRDPDVTPVAPSGWTNRFSGVVATNWVVALADFDNYLGANVVWTGLNGAGGTAQVGWIVEVK